MRGWCMLAALLIGLTASAVADPPDSSNVVPGQVDGQTQQSIPGAQRPRRIPIHACNPTDGPGIVDGNLSSEPGADAVTSVLLFPVTETGGIYIKTLKASLDRFRDMVAYFRDPRLRSQNPMVMMNLIESPAATFESKVDAGARQQFWGKVKVARIDEHGHFLCQGLSPGSYYLLAQIRKEIATPEYMAKLTQSKRVTQKTYYAMSLTVPTVPATQRVLVRARHFAFFGQQPPGDVPPPDAATPPAH